jgi:hypothetical protein
MPLMHVVVLQFRMSAFEARQPQPYTYNRLIYVSYNSQGSDRVVQNQRCMSARLDPNPHFPSPRPRDRDKTFPLSHGRFQVTPEGLFQNNSRPPMFGGVLFLGAFSWERARGIKLAC